MKLSIVIPAWNEALLLPATLAAVKSSAQEAFSNAGIAWEIIVCDNNSTDATAALAREAGATVVHEPVNQISRARNTGAQSASGEWLLFIDADSTPSPGLFVELSKALQDPSVLYGGTRMVMDSAIGGSRAVIGFWHLLARIMKWAAGSFFFVRRAAFAGVGGFSQALYAAEELDLSARLRALAGASGKRFVFLNGPPLLTSARKLKSWSMGYHVRLLWRIIASGGAALKDRRECGIWYERR